MKKLSTQSRLARLEHIVNLFNVDYLGQVTSYVEELKKKDQELSNLKYLLVKMIKNQDVSQTVKYLESGLNNKELCCVECGDKDEIHWHHVIPRSRGGNFTVPICGKCHGVIHNNDPEKFSDHSSLIKAGIEKAKSKGIKIGRKPMDPIVTENIKKCREEGNSIRGTAKLLNISKSTVLRVCRGTR